MIVFDNVTKSYSSNQECSLYKIFIKINKGDLITLVGHSGSGKSTIFKLILAEEDATDGVVSFDGKDIREFSQKELIKHRRKIGVVFQDFRLLEKLTVYENIAFAMEALEFPEEKIKNDVPYVLELVNMLDKMLVFPNELSGGEQQRTAIARAIINKPDILIADEPTGNLDPENTNDVINILKQINKLGTTVLIASHDKAIINSIGGRIIKLACGKIANSIEI